MSKPPQIHLRLRVLAKSLILHPGNPQITHARLRHLNKIIISGIIGKRLNPPPGRQLCHRLYHFEITASRFLRRPVLFDNLRLRLHLCPRHLRTRPQRQTAAKKQRRADRYPFSSFHIISPYNTAYNDSNPQNSHRQSDPGTLCTCTYSPASAPVGTDNIRPSSPAPL